MECKNCGRKSINENANYCDYCGASFRERVEYSPVHENTVAKERVEAGRNTQTVRGMNALFGDESKPMSFWNWAAVFAPLLIPSVGILIFAVLLLIWAFDKSTPVTRKNFARVFLIVIIFGFIAFLFMFSFIMTYMSDPDALMQQFMELYGM